MRHVKAGGGVRGEGLAGGDPRPVVYTSTEAHSCIQKAIELLGIGHTNLRRLPVSADWRMDVGALRAQIAEDRAAGLMPACVVATCFRYRPARVPEDVGWLDELNRRVIAGMQDVGDVFLTDTELAGRFALRACILNFRTEESDLDTLLGAIRSAGERLVSA